MNKLENIYSNNFLQNNYIIIPSIITITLVGIKLISYIIKPNENLSIN